ncbi:MAG TPA: L-threonylcarbamoyladenylate synthase [Edaphocola sp.]|nr:L-threonylcarbamoyladenylate synthase [Edaphocola sp.]
MLLKIHPQDPQNRLIRKVVDCLRQGGVIIYPTDTIYGIGCDIYQEKAVERVCKIKHIDPKKANFSFICRDLSHLSDFTRNIANPVFRMLKNTLPGPYTYIMDASKEVPRIMKNKKNTIGIRVPANNICAAILEELGHPIMSTSLPMEADVEYFTDPEIIEERFGHLVDLVIDGGAGNIVPSTVVDCTGEQPGLIREGAGVFEH